MMRRTIAATTAGVVLLTTACSGQTSAEDADTPEDGPTAAADQPVQAVRASCDRAVGDDRRFTAGLFLADAGVLIGGEVTMEFFYLGEEGPQEPVQVGEVKTAEFLPVPGLEPPGPLDAPQEGDGSAVGVYET